MKTVFNSLSIPIVLIISSVYSYSQQSPDSLVKYLGLAAVNNPIVMQRFSEYEAALKKIPQIGLPDPQLDIGAFITPMELSGGNQVADMKLMQMFPWFGVVKNGKDEMSLMAKSKFELYRDARLQVGYDVRRTWYELFKIRKDIGISEKNMEILKVIEQLSLIKYKTPVTGNSEPGNQLPLAQGNIGVSSNAGQGMQGMESNTGRQGETSAGQVTTSMQPGSMASSSGGSGLIDLYRIQIEIGELVNSIALLKNQEQTIVASFNSYLNRAPMVKVYTDEVLLPDTLDLNLLTIPDSIQTRNPMLNMLVYEREAYQARGKMVKRMGYPMVGIGVNYSIINSSDMSASSMNGTDMVMPMISVTIPVYRKKYSAMREEAWLLSKARSINYQAASNSFHTEYFMAVQLYQDALRRVKLYENQYFLASKSLEIMLKSFSTSTIALTDVLRVRQQTLDYELKQVKAIADLNTAKALLDRLMAASEI